MRRLSPTFLRHFFAIFLRVNARAANEQNSRIVKSPQKIPRAVQINSPVKIDIAAARARGMNHHIEISFRRPNLICVGNVDRTN